MSISWRPLFQICRPAASIMSISWKDFSSLKPKSSGQHHEHQLETPFQIYCPTGQHHEHQLETQFPIHRPAASIMSISWKPLRKCLPLHTRDESALWLEILQMSAPAEYLHIIRLQSRFKRPTSGHHVGVWLLCNQILPKPPLMWKGMDLVTTAAALSPMDAQGSAELTSPATAQEMSLGRKIWFHHLRWILLN